MGRRLREALIIGLLLMLHSQFCSDVFAQQHFDIVFSSDITLTETFVANTPLRASVYLTERFVFTDVFYVSFYAFLMDLSILDDIGLKLDNYRFTLLLDGMSFSESVHEFIEKFRAVGGTIISHVFLRNFVTFLALLVGCIGLLFIAQGIKAKKQ